MNYISEFISDTVNDSSSFYALHVVLVLFFFIEFFVINIVLKKCFAIEKYELRVKFASRYDFHLLYQTAENHTGCNVS